MQVTCLNCNSLLELCAEDIRYYVSGDTVASTGKFIIKTKHYEYTCVVCKRGNILNEFQITEEFKEKARYNKNKKVNGLL